MDCVSDNELVELLEGRLAPGRRAAVLTRFPAARAALEESLAILTNLYGEDHL